MDKPISVGDLVQVVKPRACCEATSDLGRFHTVTGFFNSCKCVYCNHVFEGPTALLDGKWAAKEIHRLKRIPPLDELEGQRTEENLKVPA